MQTDISNSAIELVRYHGGAVQLHSQIGISSSKVLSNKLNPNCERHQLTLNESLRLQQVTADYRILYAEARALNHVCLPVDASDLGASDMELLNLWADCIKEEGETAGEIRQALDDGQITFDEFSRINREIFEDITARLKLLERIRSLVVDAPESELQPKPSANPHSENKRTAA